MNCCLGWYELVNTNCIVTAHLQHSVGVHKAYWLSIKFARKLWRQFSPHFWLIFIEKFTFQIG